MTGRPFEIRGTGTDHGVLEKDSFWSLAEAREYAAKMLRHQEPYSPTRDHGANRTRLAAIIEVEIWEKDLGRQLEIVTEKVLIARRVA